MGKYNKIVDDLLNHKYGRLTVVDILADMDGKAMRLCRCDCGKEVSVAANRLLSGNKKSCGCLQKDNRVSSNFKHGCSNKKITKEYRIWKAMKTRCLNSNVRSYKDYGGRGIKVCERWLNDFRAFREDMGLCPEGYSIERINNNGDYSPDNCKWATYKEQYINRRIARDKLGSFCNIEDYKKIQNAIPKCRNGHYFTEDNIHIIKQGRRCKTCKEAYEKKYHATNEYKIKHCEWERRYRLKVKMLREIKKGSPHK